MFNPDKPVELETNASNFTIASVLGQRDDQGRLRPVAFFSRKLHGPELNYPIYNKEFIAIVTSFKEFQHYLHGSKHQTIMYTDHKNITFFTTTQKLNKRQNKYVETLAEFNFKIVHRKGSENSRADALSRRSNYNNRQPVIQGQILRLNNEGALEQIELGILYHVEPDRSHYDKIIQ
jgi:hypothetical protein